jgi:ketoreductase
LPFAEKVATYAFSYCLLEAMLQDKIALVTGGATGIGKAIGLQMAKNRAKVAIASRNHSRLETAAAEFEKLGLLVLPISMDVRKKHDIQRAVDAIVSQWGAIHILVNNAGISGLSMIDDPDDSKWFDIMDTNLNGLYLITKAVLKHMPDRNGGRVINISSVLGKFGVPGYTAYCTTKHGMIGFTRALALELVNRGITVNTVCPGWVDTEMAAQGIRETAASQGITPEQFKGQAIAGVPIGRFLEADEIAELVCYLASNQANGITGQAINICGGQTMA